MLPKFRHATSGVFLAEGSGPSTASGSSLSASVTHVAGFQTWKKHGRHVRKGEKGILIIAPMVYRTRVDAVDNDEAGEKSITASDLLPAAKLLNDAFSVIQVRLQQAFSGDRMTHGDIQVSLDQGLQADDASTPF